MRVGYADKVGEFTVGELRALPPGPHDVVVQVGASGICHSDHSVLAGTMPFELPLVLGHELAGTVLEVGSEVTRVRPGDKVIGASKPSCGQCWWCVREYPYLCTEGLKVWNTPRYALDDDRTVGLFCGLGSFAETTVLHELSVVPVHTDLPFEQLAIIGCAVNTGAGAVFNTAGVRPGDQIAVLGLGGVGMSIVQAAAVAGATRIIAVDPVPGIRSLALELGATDVLDSLPGPELVAQVQELTGGRGVDAGFEAVGRVDTITSAYRMTRRAGIVVTVGAPDSSSTLELGGWEAVSSGKKLTGSLAGDANADRQLPNLVRLAETGRLDVGRLVTDRIALDAQQILRSFDVHDGIRTVVIP
ncbi:alcohol dehydrogenase catalytic domain-containing protein [Nocardia sp. CA2R105]|uniref:zinc-binding dehydrogenase n=1 Tax=Nocardia coffeae TaxID=2873381 RepID=UPI001CA619B2|nr:zinc-binding dehydrogenase [Nocardia coffeae]MBY8861013.1 alcohol dehydrogenase catalytic domain-containing protein [Nocardia coffeae]